VFSNGGANQACILANMYQRKHGQPLPVNAMVLDSCPGSPNYWTGLAALTVGLPKFWPLRMFLLGFIHLLLVSFWISSRIALRQNFILKLRNSLTNPALFPLDATRVYMYSKSDKMVMWKDVEAHVIDAHKKGWAVTSELFENSPHVGHLMVDSGRYWDAVKEIA